MAKGDYKISDIYQGGYSSLASPSNGYMTAGSLGMTTDFRTANILQEVSTKISSGIKNIEVTAIQPEAETGLGFLATAAHQASKTPSILTSMRVITTRP